MLHWFSSGQAAHSALRSLPPRKRRCHVGRKAGSAGEARWAGGDWKRPWGRLGSFGDGWEVFGTKNTAYLQLVSTSKD